MVGTQQVEQFTISTQIQQLINGFGQGQLLKQLENIDFASKGSRYLDNKKLVQKLFSQKSKKSKLIKNKKNKD